MRCLECGIEFDELNESQPVCPACGTPPGTGRDDDDICALLDDAALVAAATDEAEDTDPGLGLGLDLAGRSRIRDQRPQRHLFELHLECGRVPGAVRHRDVPGDEPRLPGVGPTSPFPW